MTRDSSFSRKLAARAPLIASVAGMLISLSSVFYFVEDDFRRILGVTAGLFCLLLASITRPIRSSRTSAIVWSSGERSSNSSISPRHYTTRPFEETTARSSR